MGKKLVMLLPLVLLVGCTKTVYRDRVVEVKVPVVTECVVDRPEDVVSLRDTLSREQWNALTTDQRQNLVGAQALDHKIYGDKLSAATAGCL